MPRFDSKMLRFIAVGVVNTLVGALLMFVLYNVAHLSYWVSSVANYVAGSILSFVLNRSFTFRNTDSVAKTAPRFVVNIVLCYLASYGAARPALSCVLRSASSVLRDNVAMAAGMVLFTALNYAGQRYFVFKENKEEKQMTSK